MVVDAPLREVYNQWTQFEEFRTSWRAWSRCGRSDDKRLYWRAKIGGTEASGTRRSWTVTPDRRIAWKSLTGPEHGGAVLFRPVNDGRTEVTLARCCTSPEGMTEQRWRRARLREPSRAGRPRTLPATTSRSAAGPPADGGAEIHGSQVEGSGPCMPRRRAAPGRRAPKSRRCPV